MFPGGYRFEPSVYSPPIGHSALDFELDDDPDRRSVLHTATFVVGPSRLAHRTFHDHTQLTGRHEQVRVGPGHFELNGGRGPVAGGFSFGGQLEVKAAGDTTVGHLSSTAPVFELNSSQGHSLSLFVTEVEAQLAGLHAAWGKDDAGFAERVLSTDPLDLFVASLVTLQAYLDRFAHSTSFEDYRAAEDEVERMIATLSAYKQWPLQPTGLAELLAPPEGHAVVHALL